MDQQLTRRPPRYWSDLRTRILTSVSRLSVISFRASPMTASPKPKWCVVSRHQRCIHLLTQHGSTSNPLRPLSSSAYTTPPRLSCKLYTPPRQKLQQPPFCQSLPEQPTSTRSSRCSTIRLRSPPETPFVPTSHFSCHTSCPQRRGHLQATSRRRKTPKRIASVRVMCAWTSCCRSCCTPSRA